MAELWALWDQHFPKRPKHINRSFLESRLTFRIQEMAYGAVPVGIRRHLVEAGAAHSRIRHRLEAATDDNRQQHLIPGTVLIREWDERQYRVTVTPDGLYELNGQVFKSLSAAARHITGTQWNGPKFFGLRGGRGRRNEPIRDFANRPAQTCAVYCRVSSDERLDQSFNSIDAQKEAGHAFTKGQSHEGWIAVADAYDDGGYSGGNMERPALKRLLAGIERGLIDIVVVYKIDHLTRSLADFSKMVEVFERHSVSFVSVTQQFNTTSSMGRLMLNVLLSFAQFEREVTGERIRDKIAAAKRKGMWMGGVPPLGYDVVGRKLVINKAEARLVRRIFDDFVNVGSTTTMAKTYAAEGQLSKMGKPFTKQTIYKMLHNRMYLGEIVHKGQSYPMRNLAAMWPTLYPAEQRRLPQLLIERVLLGGDGLEIVWRDLGWQELVASLQSGTIGAELQELEAEQA